MINIAVIDDEVRMLDMVCELIRRELAQDDTVNIIAFSNGEDFLQEIAKREQFDILLCDIEMKEIDGIALGKIVKQKCPEIYLIYLTAYSGYGAESYKVGAYQYILKEDLEQRLFRVFYPLIQRRLDLIGRWNEMEKQEFNYAGNLMEEMTEIQKIIPDKDQAIDYNTVTVDCGYVLSLTCC